MARESDVLRGVAVGAGSAVLALGVGEFLGVALADASLVASVGDVAVDLAPGWLVRRTIGILGVAQKPVLLTGIVCVAVVLGGWVGSRGTSGRIALGLAGLLGALAALRSGAGYGGVLAAAAAVGVGILSLGASQQKFASSRSSPPSPTSWTTNRC